jgi:hypothetical protein
LVGFKFKGENINWTVCHWIFPFTQNVLSTLLRIRNWLCLGGLAR